MGTAFYFILLFFSVSGILFLNVFFETLSKTPMWIQEQAPMTEEPDVTIESSPLPEKEETTPEEPQPKKTNFSVPYINEAPENNWTGSWKNACEEATIVMIDAYYQGKTSVSIPDAKIYLQNLFAVQQAAYGSDANSDVARTREIIQNHATFGATIVNDPTIEAIKKELDEGRPVIAFHRGFDLHNNNIPFLATGSSYHTTVIKGYDDETQTFITNDPGDTVAGADHGYDVDLFMNSLHDYRYETKLADGPPRVLFTRLRRKPQL